MPTRIDPDRLAAWRLFLEAHAAVTSILASELQDEEDLPLTWYDVLVQLSEADDRRLRMQELAERVLLSKSGLTRLVDRMEKQGLIERVPCADDRRGTWAVLTDTGFARLRDAAPSHVASVRRHFADHLEPDEVSALRSALGRIVEGTRES